MAILKSKADGRFHHCGSPSLVGRDAGCDLRLGDGRVSSLHARIVFRGSEWSVEDLGSRNGVAVNGKPVDASGRILQVGDVVCFGSREEAWKVRSLAPPVLMAQRAGGETVHGTDLLCLPSMERPDVTVLRSLEGHWIMERQDDVAAVEHRETVVVDGESWRLFLPGDREATREESQQLVLTEATLVFTVSRDEENVRLVVRGGRREVDLKVRSHHYLLLTLARARQVEDAQDDVAAAEAGWLYQEDLCRMLAMDSNAVYLLIHRARRQLEASGVVGAAHVVERRPGSRQLRLGLGRVEIQRG